MLIFVVYIPPSTSYYKESSKEDLCGAISDLKTVHPCIFFIVAEDFNYVNLKSVLPKFRQHVNFTALGTNTLDLIYKTAPLPQLGCSDHISVMLIPAHRPVLKFA